MNTQQILVCTTASIPAFWFMYTYLNIPTKLFSMFAFMAMLFLMILTYVFNQKICVNLKFKVPSPRLLFLLIYIFCLLIVLFTPSANESVFINLSSLAIINWLRTGAGLLLGLFLPGYALTSLFKHKLNLILLLTSSILLTVFLNSVIAFTAVKLAQSSLAWILTINVVIIAVSLIDTIRNKTEAHSFKEWHKVTATLDNEHILMLLLCIFQTSILISVFILSGLTVPNGDMWDHAFFATRLEKGEFLRFGLLNYPPFFSAHLFSVSQLTGLPTISISNILGLTNVVTVLIFYALVLTLAQKKSVAFLSTFAFTLFGSFIFLVQAILGKLSVDPQKLGSALLQVSGKTLQTNSVYTLVNNYAYGPVTLDLISVLFLVALLLKRDKGRILYAVEAILIANLFLLHIAETIYVLIFLLVALLLSLSRIKDLASLTSGIWLGTAVLSITSFAQFSVALYVTAVYSVLLVSSLLFTRVRLLQKSQDFYKKALGVMPKRHLKAFLAFVILSSYGLFMLVWTVVYLDQDGYVPDVLSYLGAAPTYFMPIAFGIPLIFSMLYLAKYLLSKDMLSQNEIRVLIFLVAAFIIAYLFGKALTFESISGYAIYRELRVLSIFGGIVFSIFTGYALHRALRHIESSKTSQRHALAVGLGFLILLGSGSTFLSTVFWTNTGMGAYPLPSKEIEALDFLKRMAKASDVVLTYNQESQKKVGLTGAVTINRFNMPFSSVSSSIPRIVLQVVNYIYLTKQDYEAIQSSDTYIKALLPILPIIFNNTELVIFGVPSNFKRYMGSLSVPVVISGDMEAALPKLAILDSLGVSYRVYDYWDPGILAGSSTIVLTGDVENESIAQKYVDWAQNGGTLIVFGDKAGYYSNLMGIRAKTHLTFQESWLSEASFGNWSFDLRDGLSSDDISISEPYQYQGRNSLLVNATRGGTLGLSHPREEPRNFPFAIGTWFMLLENRSTIENSLILMNGLASGVGLWDRNYNLDYYYDGGKIIYNIAEISPQSWQKIELYFPDAGTCCVYLNDTLVVIGPRSTKYDPSDVTYGSEQKSALGAWFAGSYQALWNGLYYLAPEIVTTNGLLYNEESIPVGFEFEVAAPKESLHDNVQTISWYALDHKRVAPLAHTSETGAGRITYVDFAFPPKAIPKLSDFSRILLESLDPSLLNYIKQDNTEMKLFTTEIYGTQSLNGNVNILSDTMAFYGLNATFSSEFSNGTRFSTNIDSLAFNSPYESVLSLNGAATVQPFHDEYNRILVPNSTTLSLTFPRQAIGNLTCVSDKGQIELYNATELIISSSSPVNAIVRHPNINVTGVAKFEGAFFDVPYNNVVGSGLGALTLQGEMTYNILFSDDTLARSCGDQVAFVGSYSYDYPSIPQIELPLSFILTGQNLILIMIIIVYAAFVILLLKH